MLLQVLVQLFGQDPDDSVPYQWQTSYWSIAASHFSLVVLPFIIHSGTIPLLKGDCKVEAIKTLTSSARKPLSHLGQLLSNLSPF